MDKNTSSKQYKRPYILYISSQEVKILFTILNIYSRHNSSPNSGIWFSPMAILLLTLEFGSVPCQIFSPLWNCFSPSTILLPTEIWFSPMAIILTTLEFVSVPWATIFLILGFVSVPWQFFSSHHSGIWFSLIILLTTLECCSVLWQLFLSLGQVEFSDLSLCTLFSYLVLWNLGQIPFLLCTFSP